MPAASDRFVAIKPLAGSYAKGTGLIALFPAAGCAIWAWLLWREPWPLQLFGAPIFLAMAALAFVMLAMALWMQVTRAVWHLQADPRHITLCIQTASGWPLKREVLAVDNLRAVEWIAGDDDYPSGLRLHALTGKGFLIPAEVVDGRAFAAFAARCYPLATVTGP